MPEVVVTGIGLISPIGLNVNENLKSLIDNISGIGAIELLDTVLKDEYLAAEINETNKKLAQRFGTQNSDYPRATLLALNAVSEAVGDSGWLNDDIPTAVITGSTVGGIDKTMKYYRSEQKDKSFFYSQNYGFTSERIADYLNCNYYVSSVSTACSSSANAIAEATKLIKAGYIERAIAGGTDALSAFTLNGFKSLYILSKGQCKPFDKNRRGLNLGEAAAYLVLESDKLAKDKKQYCKVSGYANVNDAFHASASSEDGEGAFLAMKEAIDMAEINPEDIDYLNAHGTGTLNNDLAEGIAIKRLFHTSYPPFSSTKPYTGHTLGAAGAVEAVFSVLSIYKNLIFPSLNFDEAMDEHGLMPIKKQISNKVIKNVMSNSFGFGGNNTSLIFSK